MKNNKGFTLVEIIATIGVLLLIATITVPSVITIQKKNKEKNYNKIVDTIIASAENYYHGSLANLSEGTSCYITLKDLANKNLIKTPITDPRTNTVLNLDEKIILKLEDKEIIYEFDGGDSVSSKCSIKENVEGKYRDLSGANSPVLASGMIPVIYDETCESSTAKDNANGCWEVADTNTEWYDYNEQMWANAVTTSVASYRTASVGTEIPMNDINSMWVWIPRYSYEIDGTYGKYSNGSDGTKELPGLIDVVFDVGTTNIDSTKTNHKAFKFGKELTGFWVGKFELGGKVEEPLIKPNIPCISNVSINDLFISSLKFAGGILDDSDGYVKFEKDTNNEYGLNTTSNTTNTHMIKNKEWGAVALLSQSKYGKMGNDDYAEANKEIYVNNSTVTYTGKSSGTPSYTFDGNANSGTYSYNEVNSGTGASTTGTIYGVYDMNGGGAEFVSSVYTANIESCYFCDVGNSKYYESYKNNDFQSNNMEGTATTETKNWYNDWGATDFNRGSFIRRGGTSVDSQNANGIFNYGVCNEKGSGSDADKTTENTGNTTTRVVLIP